MQEWDYAVLFKRFIVDVHGLLECNWPVFKGIARLEVDSEALGCFWSSLHGGGTSFDRYQCWSKHDQESFVQPLQFYSYLFLKSTALRTMAWWLWLHAVVASCVLLSSLADYSQVAEATQCFANNTVTKITDGEWALPEFRAISSIWKTSEQIWACYFSQADFLFPCSEPFSHPAENYLVNDVRGWQKVNIPLGFFWTLVSVVLWI